MGKELFIMGDPHWLSGGAATSRRITYGEPAPTVGTTLQDRCTAKTLAGHFRAGNDMGAILRSCGQAVHSGRASYHDRPQLNVFLEENDEFPSVGVELETILRTHPETRPDDFVQASISNWFHFEEDGSLRSVGEGYECITEPLPSRVYRDARTWIGLQNILAPYVYSWDTSATGLHVHVGLSRFDTCSMASVPKFLDTLSNPRRYRRQLGRILMLRTQMAVADEALLSEVFLRPRSSYCGRCGRDDEIVRVTAGSSRVAKISARDFVADSAVACGAAVHIAMDQAYRALMTTPGAPQAIVKDFIANKSRVGANVVAKVTGDATGHHSEYNCDHSETFEFRRGKGTLNGLSVHRMVEYCALVEKYAEEILGHPDMEVSNKGFRKFLADNTTSETLRRTALNKGEK